MSHIAQIAATKDTSKTKRKFLSITSQFTHFKPTKYSPLCNKYCHENIIFLSYENKDFLKWLQTNLNQEVLI